MTKVWIVAIGLFVAGLVICGIGLTYDIVFAGIPYPDPTPAQQAGYQFHATVATRTVLAGAAAIAASVLAGAVATMQSLLALWSTRDAGSAPFGRQ